MIFTDMDGQPRAFNRANVVSVAKQRRNFRNGESVPPFDVTTVETYTGFGWCVMEPFEQVAKWLEDGD